MINVYPVSAQKPLSERQLTIVFFFESVLLEESVSKTELGCWVREAK